MKYCTRCGAELVDEAVVCTKCGCAVGNKSVVGSVELVLGIVGLVYSIITYSSDTTRGAFGMMMYSYTSPFTGHEIMVIAIFIISIVAIIVGVVTLAKANTAKTYGDIDDLINDGGVSRRPVADEPGRTDYRTWWDSDGGKHESWVDADGNKHET